MSYSLIGDDGFYYIDPFTNEKAIFPDRKSALMLSMMLFDQQQRELKVIEN